MEQKRRPFQGVLNILSFNRHFYFYGLLVLAIILTSGWFIDWPITAFLLVILTFLYGLVAPLVVSAYVYDFSGYYDMYWLGPFIKDYTSTKQIVNINAGFDETSFIIKRIFPNSDLKVFD